MTDTTRERILTHAARLFVERGYHGVSMREVAEAVGVTKPALYHHYADKEALFLAILDASLADLETLLAAARAEAGVREQLTALVGRMLTDAPRYRAGLQLASELKHVTAERRANFEGRYRAAWAGGIAALIGQGVQNGTLREDVDAAFLARTLMGLAYPLVTSGRPVDDPDGLARTLVSVYLDGVARR
ncbi:TetR/AcrR family transcriptional regulator [Deinococcus maricopensis]|uniref:Regulatory protein TetR n=1 Tax=Deinococcus maricopensis (strain DSM 21211 / LMG 22137 / NRRL B-23946 / LB-34) TaxID=709986 RepID=E8U9P7_DEIML|nr:TetR/AcrR family transcriptional regulator [Deinococcus maricopensis]ADV67786.1 regulatory protein TetR [Deinococcus maricopensis DSM 21211]